MEGSIQSGCDERSSVFKVFQDCIFYLEEDEEIPTVNLNSDGYFIDDLGSGVLLVEDDGDEKEGDGDEYWDEPCFDNADFGNRPPRIRIDSEDDINKMDLKAFSPHEIVMYDFASLDVAFKFYSVYARRNGFCARKSSVVRSRKTREPYQQEYVCNREGERRSKGKVVGQKKREPRVDFRCHCKAKFRVHVDCVTGRWYCTWFDDDHNHDMLDAIHCEMLPGHRKMSVSDIHQMNHMMKVGIGPPHIYRSLALQAGGYHKIGFKKKDLYNQIHRQRREQSSDAVAALRYLHEIRSKDPMMYFEHTIDNEGRLQHLFWCDGICQLNYQLFGDVLAFDATYGKNKYFLPLVVFSGVNHHNRSTIFAAAIVSNETEETYVWLLSQLMKVMKGKEPNAVITDGDNAMRNAIKKVFPNAYHRLCAWHLLRNATSNVGRPGFTAELKKCMMRDYDLCEFQQKWDQMVTKYHLEENHWVVSLYEKRSMWATAHNRGKFFAGFRTTSRCESLHAELAKFVHSRYNLNDFLHHFQQCMDHMRFKEREDDFASLHGDPVLQTNFPEIEKSAGKYLTKDLFLKFRTIIDRASDIEVVSCTKTLTVLIYNVCTRGGGGKEWQVTHNPTNNGFKCVCMRMESRGLACEHIVAVLAHLSITELPRCLVLKRWSKGAKDLLNIKMKDGNTEWNSLKSDRNDDMTYLLYVLLNLNNDTNDEYNNFRERTVEYIAESKARKSCAVEAGSSSSQFGDENLRDPVRARTKGRGGRTTTSTGIAVPKRKKCSKCKQPGHNRDRKSVV